MCLVFVCMSWNDYYLVSPAELAVGAVCVLSSATHLSRVHLTLYGFTRFLITCIRPPMIVNIPRHFIKRLPIYTHTLSLSASRVSPIYLYCDSPQPNHSILFLLSQDLHPFDPQLLHGAPALGPERLKVLPLLAREVSRARLPADHLAQHPGGGVVGQGIAILDAALPAPALDLSLLDAAVAAAVARGPVLDSHAAGGLGLGRRRQRQPRGRSGTAVGRHHVPGGADQARHVHGEVVQIEDDEGEWEDSRRHDARVAEVEGRGRRCCCCCRLFFLLLVLLLLASRGEREIGGREAADGRKGQSQAEHVHQALGALVGRRGADGLQVVQRQALPRHGLDAALPDDAARGASGGWREERD